MILNWPLIGSNLVALASGTAYVAGIGYLIRRAVARKSARDAYVGWFAYGFAISNYFGWGIPRLNTPPGMYSGALSFFGMGFGLLLGNILGAFLWRHYRKKMHEAEQHESETDEDAKHE